MSAWPAMYTPNANGPHNGNANIEDHQHQLPLQHQQHQHSQQPSYQQQQHYPPPLHVRTPIYHIAATM